ncbi:MAG: 16S rRNA (guanine(527)-N(7))-methyltransferase RsmG [Clostridiales bacterium]|nr:16S rRNA (guanine(527)-N(7))-methyltransferase RsmG [Clostridiales bacterium]
MDINSYPEIDNLKKGLKDFGIELTESQIEQFIRYHELLMEWNKVMNLTTITELNEVILKHFIDSLAIMKVKKPVNERIIDVGTGAGFPGIPIKIVFPDTDITLLDSLNKRIKFLNEVISELKLDKIHTIHGRAEDFGKDINYREKFDLCVSRAVANLSSLSEYCIPFVKEEGYFIPYKSGNSEEEINQAGNAIKQLGGRLEKVIEFNLPFSDIERTLVTIRKISKTPKKYPRSAGKPTKEPL